MFLNLRNFDVTVDVTLRVVASIHAQKNRGRNTYRVLWRHDGRQRSLTFENLPAAEHFKTLMEDHDPHEALRIVELDEIGHHVPTVTAWLHTHIDNLTGVRWPPSRATAPTSPETSTQCSARCRYRQ